MFCFLSRSSPCMRSFGTRRAWLTGCWEGTGPLDPGEKGGNDRELPGLRPVIGRDGAIRSDADASSQARPARLGATYQTRVVSGHCACVAIRWAVWRSARHDTKITLSGVEIANQQTLRSLRSLVALRWSFFSTPTPSRNVGVGGLVRSIKVQCVVRLGTLLFIVDFSALRTGPDQDGASPRKMWSVEDRIPGTRDNMTAWIS